MHDSSQNCYISAPLLVEKVVSNILKAHYRKFYNGRLITIQKIRVSATPKLSSNGGHLEVFFKMAAFFNLFIIISLFICKHHVFFSYLFLNRGSYMSAHVLLNLLNELGKRDKMRGLPSILSLLCIELNKFNNTRARMLDSIYHMTNTLKSHFWRKNVIILSLCTQRCYGRHIVSRKSINH